MNYITGTSRHQTYFATLDDQEKLVNTKQAQAMSELFIQTIGKRKFTNWSRHLEEPYESRGSRTVL